MIGFSKSLTGLKVSDIGMKIATNNLTNVNTSGYKRQRALQAEQVGRTIGYNYVGIGARVYGVQQIFSELKEEIYQDTLAKYGEYDAVDKTYGYIQSITGTIGDTGMFKTVTEDLWESINLLATDPSSLTYRTSFLGSAVSFINQSEEMMNQLSAFQGEINEQIKGCVTEINRYAEEISELNKKITYYDAMGIDSNEAKDKRSYAIEKLSEIVEVNVETCRNGSSLAVRVGGAYLVSETKTHPMGLGSAQETSIYDVPIWSATGAKVEVKSGKLKGLLDSRGYDIVANLTDPTNGSPKEKVDLVITIDPTMDAEKIDEIKQNISSMLNQLDRYSTDYKLYVNYMGTSDTYSFDNRGDFETFIEGNIDGTNDFTGSIAALKDVDYRDNSSKYLMVFADGPIDGDASTTKADLYDTIRTLTELDMRVIAVTDTENADNLTWRTLTDATNGSTYDISKIETEEGFSSIGADFVHDANTRLNENDYDAIIPSVKAELNTFVNVLVREINAIFQDGINEYGENNQDGSLNLFVRKNDNLPWQIGNIAVNLVYSDTNKLPLSISGDPGDNRLVQRMVELREANVFSNNKQDFSFDGFYSNFVLELGTNAGAAVTNLRNQEDVVQDADDKRKQVSGVSTDEELTKIIKYQYAYTASSKMINVISEMLETMVNII